MNSWTIACNGVEKTLADWGLDSPVRKLVSQGQDELAFRAVTASADSTPVFPYRSTITLYRNRIATGGGFSYGTIWFTGIVIQVPRRGAPAGEDLAYKVAGPWWYLDNYTFQQGYKNVFLGYALGTTTPLFGPKNSSHLFLNLGFTISGPSPWSKITTGQQITEALNWALQPFTSTGAPAPFQIGTVSPAADAPVDEVRDITCAEVIHKMLRWTPDAVTWFDYSTSPPTFNCKRRSELPSENVELTGDVLATLALNPRYDLQAPSVRIYYEIASSVNGQQSLSLVEDHYPDPLPTDAPSQFASLQFTVDLQGLQSTVATAIIAVDSINPADPNWWLSKHPQLDPSDSRTGVQSFTIDPASVERIANPPLDSMGNPVADKGYTLELTSGQIADWMNKDAQRLTIKVHATITFKNGTVLGNQPLSYQCLSSNATAGTYQSQNVSVYPEPVPVGLAQAIYESISPLQYEGSVSLLELECSGRVLMGAVLNLPGAAIAGWSNMNALVQRVTEDLTTGTTTVDFGPPKILSAGELVDLLRASRLRNIRSSYSMRPSGDSNASNGSVALGRQLPEKNSIPGNNPANPHVTSENPDGTGGTITTSASGGNASIVLGAAGSGAATNTISINLMDAAGQSLRIRQLNVCQDGVPGTIMVLCSPFVAS